MASVAFANIPTTGMVNGDMYNITDSFTTDARFVEGAGVSVSAGTNIAWVDSVSKWDILAPGGGSGSLSGLSDVTITTPTSGQFLGYDGTKWENVAAPSGVPVGGTTDQVLAKNSNTDGDTKWMSVPKLADITGLSQTGATASQAITRGTFFYLNGSLVKAIADIANGATFTLNTNYEEQSVCDELELLNSTYTLNFTKSATASSNSNVTIFAVSDSQGYVDPVKILNGRGETSTALTKNFCSVKARLNDAETIVNLTGSVSANGAATNTSVFILVDFPDITTNLSPVNINYYCTNISLYDDWSPCFFYKRDVGIGKNSRTGHLGICMLARASQALPRADIVFDGIQIIS